MNLIKLNDIKAIPDIIHEYKPSTKDSQVPLVIDNGSYQCRVGWSSNDDPLLIFRNLIAKPRKDRTKKDASEVVANPPIQIGNDIINIEAMRFQLKTQFDRNVVTHFYNQEQIFDYIFTHLGIDTNGGVPHPIIMTEALGNPNYCRQLMSELLFECYDVPSVCYSIDSMNSFTKNKIGPNGLIISFGYHTTHVIPVLGNKNISTKARRINIGGYHIITFLFRLMQLKYPVHLNAITISRMESLMQGHCSVSKDYMENLKKWSHLDYYEQNVKKIQLPYTLPTQPTIVSAEQRMEKRRELSKRLTEIKAKKREEQLVEDEEQIIIMSNIRNLYVMGDLKRFEAALRENDIANLEELEKLIASAKSRVEKTKQKMLLPPPLESQIIVPEEKPVVVPQPPANVSIEEWVTSTRNKRTQLIEKRHNRKQRRQDLAKRRTAAAQERMRIISHLARKEKGSDNFGMRDEDWDVYKVISKDCESDSDAENEKLLEVEDILRHHDPMFEEPVIMLGGAAEYHQLHVGVETIRATELLFQPSMIGSSECGLAELIDFVLKLFSPHEQLLLAQNVFLTGGCSLLPGLKERISKELLEMRPFQSPHNIFMADSASLDAWFGTRDLSRSELLAEFLTTKQDYEEKGSEYFKEHPTSNYFFNTPIPVAVESPNE
ncbi:actin-related protein 5 [Episyrphus balteatus]|uniref:actin-related protein 5 n=1 Tax=Episyrphus balteatus TaxID=286459 RepID=UPI002486B187|nr:actin-related protein 5 [Episyrphus balteatus]